jgi:hypothetical protein
MALGEHVSDMQSCLIAFGIYAVCFFGIVRVWTKSQAAQGLSLRSVVRFRTVTKKSNDRALDWMLLSIPVIRLVFGGSILTLGTAGFAALGAICGWNLLILQELKQILRDFYQFMERLLVPQTVLPDAG